jgi:hypothetical protein
MHTFWRAIMPVGWVAGAALVGSAVQADAAGDAADAQRAGAREASGVSREMFDISRGQQQPFMQSGYGANDTLSRLLGLPTNSASQQGMSVPGSAAGTNLGAAGMPNWQQYLLDNPDVAADPVFSKNPQLHYSRHGQGEGRQLPMIQQNASTDQQGYAADNTGLPTGYLTQTFGPEQFRAGMDPGYQWRQQQGAQNVMNSAAAGSGSLSGPALRALMEAGQGMASQEFGSAFDRFQTQQGNIFQRLSSIAGLGQNAAAGVGNNAVATGNTIGGNITGAANAAAAGQIGQANAIGGGLTDAASMYYLYGGKKP